MNQLGANLEPHGARTPERATAIDLMGTLEAAVGYQSQIKRILRLLVLVRGWAPNSRLGF
jgi:hypothetical protein